MTKRSFYGYKLVAAGGIVQMMTLGCVYTYGVIFSELETEFGWSRAVISGAASLFFLLYGKISISNNLENSVQIQTLNKSKIIYK